MTNIPIRIVPIFVNDKRLLNTLHKKGLILYEDKRFNYVDYVKDKDGQDVEQFELNGIVYGFKYHSGCFMPYLYIIGATIKYLGGKGKMNTFKRAA